MTPMIAPLTLLVINLVLVVVNWRLQPERASTWTAMGAMAAVMLAALMVSQTLAATAPGKDAAAAIRRAVTFAGVIFAVTLGLRLAVNLDFLGAAYTGRRMTMAVIGVYFASIGNLLPKQVARTTSLACSAATQAFQRLAGWTWVLTGLTYAMVWLTLPLFLAQPVSLGVMAIGMLVVITQLARLPYSTRSA